MHCEGVITQSLWLYRISQEGVKYSKHISQSPTIECCISEDLGTTPIDKNVLQEGVSHHTVVKVLWS